MGTNRYLEAVRRVPRGETRTFAEIAAMAGRPGAARAAGRALASCAAGSDVPWHRIVSAGGELPRGEEQLRRLRREGARPRATETVARWARRVGCGLVGQIPGRHYVAAGEVGSRDWGPLAVEPLRDEAAALARSFTPLEGEPSLDRPSPVERPRVPRRPVAPIAARLERIDWDAAQADLQSRGFLHEPELLSPAECDDLISCWSSPPRFEREIEMGPKGYGVGSYRYFREPLPEPARSLRRLLYDRLRRPAAAHRPAPAGAYPPTLAAFWKQCRAAGQRRASSILLRYGAGGINHPHRDIYGPEWFPFQALVVLSRAGRDFAGGSFVLVEEHANGEERWIEVPASEGDLVVFASTHRWLPRGSRRRKLPLRHAMTMIRRGERFGLGLVFHLAE